jgi:hypothetical protein
MNNEIDQEKYRRLPVTALITGILVFAVGAIYNFSWMLIGQLLEKLVDRGTIPNIVVPVLSVIFGLAVTAVVCGSIDLKKIKNGTLSRKGKGFDITGIVLGGLFIFAALWLLLGELLVPH